MKTKALTITGLLSLFFTFTFAQVNTVDSSKMINLRIDPKTAKGGKVSQFFDEVSFIPLETTKESLFGAISKIEVVDDCYVIYDRDTKAVLIFDNKGKFKSKITADKIDPDNSASQAVFYGYSIKKQSDSSLIRIFSGKTNVYFNLDGKLKSKVAAKDDTYDWGVRFSDGTEVVESRPGDDDVLYDFMLLKNFKQIAAYFPFPKTRYQDNYFSSTVDPITDSKITDEKFYTRTFDYNIYTFTPKKLYLSYRLLLPAENSFPVDFTSNPIYFGKRKDYFNKQPNRISEIRNIYKIGSNLFFKIYTLNGNEMRDGLIYNLKNSSLTSIKNLEPDQLSMFLPITDMDGFDDFDNSGFQIFDGTYLYTNMSSLAMFTFKEQSAGKNAKYNSELQSYFKTQDRKSNPVIIKLKPKKI
jgi:hypothetical protein